MTVIAHLGQPEVHDLGLAFCRDHDVGALNVAVDDALAVGLSQPGRDLHDDMGSTLQSISVMSEIARMKSTANTTESIAIIEKIGGASRDMVEKMNDIVWAVNPQNDNFENIILRMRAFGGELLAGKDIALHFKSDSGLNSIKL